MQLLVFDWWDTRTGCIHRVLPPRVSEVVGVCHLKAYIFDDSVLISGEGGAFPR